MGYYEKRKKRIWIYLLILIAVAYYYINGPIYECSKVNKNSEWYVNGMYMSTQYYYDNLLDDKEKDLYRTLFYKIKDIETEFYLNGNIEQSKKALHALICDHPELINIKSYSCNYSGDSTRIKINYLTTSKLMLKLKERKLQRKIKKIVEDTKQMSEYEKEKYVYEWIGKNNVYMYDKVSSEQSAYLAFSSIDKISSPIYAKAAQILLANVGVNSIININEDHMWNTVRLDDEYYFLDLSITGKTGESFEGNVSYAGLNQNINTTNYKILYPTVLPNVVGEKYNYYNKQGLIITYSSDKIDIIKNLIQKSDFKKVEIRFTNIENAEREIEEKYLDYLGIEKIIKFEEKKEERNFFENSGVLMFVKK